MCKGVDWHGLVQLGEGVSKGPKTRPVQRYRLMIRSGSVEMEGSPSGKLAWRSNHDGNVNDTWLVCS